MPQAIGFLLFTIGAPLAVVNAVTLSGAIGTALIATGLSVGASYAANALKGRPDQPRAEDGQLVIRQPVAPRKSGYGRQRLGGVFMCYEVADNGASVDVLALHHGEVDAFERYFLGDDEVTLDGYGHAVHPQYYRNGSDYAVALATTFGVDSESALGFVISLLPSIWTTDHRGDGIASFMMVASSVSEANFTKTYPNGLPTPTVVARLQKVYDPRTGETAWTPNAALCLAHYLTSPHGCGFAWDVVIAPAIDWWIAAADICDEQVALKEGGSRSRYETHGTYTHSDDPSNVIKAMLSTFDGWLWQRPDGSIGVRAGQFYTPTVLIGDDHIRGYTLQLGEAIERSVTEIKATFLDHSQDFASAEADPWILPGVDAMLDRSLPRQIDLSWVGYHSQARRLMKREAARAAPWAQGSITTDLYGLNALGERYIAISISELGPQFENLVVEVVSMEVDLTSGATINWRTADASIDDWDPMTEEGTAPGTISAYVPGATTPPVDVAAVATTIADATFIAVTFSGEYDDMGLRIWLEWRLTDIGGGIPGSWQSTSYPAASDGYGGYAYSIGPVIAGTSYDVRVAIVTAAGTLTDYSAPPVTVAT